MRCEPSHMPQVKDALIQKLAFIGALALVSATTMHPPCSLQACLNQCMPSEKMRSFKGWLLLVHLHWYLLQLCILPVHFKHASVKACHLKRCAHSKVGFHWCILAFESLFSCGIAVTIKVKHGLSVMSLPYMFSILCKRFGVLK